MPRWVQFQLIILLQDLYNLINKLYNYGKGPTLWSELSYATVTIIVCKIHHSIIVIDNTTYVRAQNGSCDSVELRKKGREEPTTTATPRSKTGKAFALHDQIFWCTLFFNHSYHLSCYGTRNYLTITFDFTS